MSNLLYSQWLDSIARRDNAMLFIVVSALATIGAWLALRDVLPTRRVFVYGAVLFYYTTLVVVGIWGGVQ